MVGTSVGYAKDRGFESHSVTNVLLFLISFYFTQSLAEEVIVNDGGLGPEEGKTRKEKAIPSPVPSVADSTKTNQKSEQKAKMCNALALRSSFRETAAINRTNELPFSISHILPKPGGTALKL